MTILDAPTAPMPRHGFTTATVPPPLRVWPSCGRVCPDGLGVVCTEDAGHEPRDHVARGMDRRVIRQWSSIGGP